MVTNHRNTLFMQFSALKAAGGDIASRPPVSKSG